MVKCYTKKNNADEPYVYCIGGTTKKRRKKSGITIKQKPKPKPAPKAKPKTIKIKRKKKVVKPTAKGVMTIQPKIKTTRKLKNKSTIKAPLTKSKVKVVKKVIPKKKSTAQSILFMGNTQKLIKSFSRATKKEQQDKIKAFFKVKKNKEMLVKDFLYTYYEDRKEELDHYDEDGDLKVKVRFSSRGKAKTMRRYELEDEERFHRIEEEQWFQPSTSMTNKMTTDVVKRLVKMVKEGKIKPTKKPITRSSVLDYVELLDDPGERNPAAGTFKQYVEDIEDLKPQWS